jgi:hypothetical protein
MWADYRGFGNAFEAIIATKPLPTPFLFVLRPRKCLPEDFGSELNISFVT